MNKRATLTVYYPLDGHFSSDSALERAVGRPSAFSGSDGSTREMGWHFDDELEAHRTSTRLRALGYTVSVGRAS